MAPHEFVEEWSSARKKPSHLSNSSAMKPIEGIILEVEVFNFHRAKASKCAWDWGQKARDHLQEVRINRSGQLIESPKYYWCWHAEREITFGMKKKRSITFRENCWNKLSNLQFKFLAFLLFTNFRHSQFFFAEIKIPSKRILKRIGAEWSSRAILMGKTLDKSSAI